LSFESLLARLAINLARNPLGFLLRERLQANIADFLARRLALPAVQPLPVVAKPNKGEFEADFPLIATFAKTHMESPNVTGGVVWPVFAPPDSRLLAGYPYQTERTVDSQKKLGGPHCGAPFVLRKHNENLDKKPFTILSLRCLGLFCPDFIPLQINMQIAN
jgi:hypothetical protein